MPDRAFPFLHTNHRPAKPRSSGLTAYVRNYGPEVNLFVDHSQIVQLECLRSGIWGTSATWGRILTYECESEAVPSPAAARKG